MPVAVNCFLSCFAFLPLSIWSGSASSKMSVSGLVKLPKVVSLGVFSSSSILAGSCPLSLASSITFSFFCKALIPASIRPVGPSAIPSSRTSPGLVMLPSDDT